MSSPTGPTGCLRARNTASAVCKCEKPHADFLSVVPGGRPPCGGLLPEECLQVGHGHTVSGADGPPHLENSRRAPTLLNK